MAASVDSGVHPVVDPLSALVIDFAVDLPVNVVSRVEVKFDILLGLLSVLGLLLVSRHVSQDVPNTGGFLHLELSNIESSVFVPSVDTLLGVIVNWASSLVLSNLKWVESLVLAGGLVSVQKAGSLTDNESGINSIIEVS